MALVSTSVVGVGPPAEAVRRVIVARSVCLAITVVSRRGVSVCDIFMKQTVRRIFTKFDMLWKFFEQDVDSMGRPLKGQLVTCCAGADGG